MGVSRHLFRVGVLGAVMTAMVALSAAVATAEELPDASCQVQSTWRTTITQVSLFPSSLYFSSAQTFTAAHSGSLTTANLLVNDSKNTGSLVVQIRPVDASGAPSTTALASTSIPASQIPDLTYSGVSAHFSPGAEVVAGQQYAIFLYTSDGHFSASTNDASSPSCPGMLYTSTDGGGSFSSSSSEDLIFSTFVEARPLATDDPSYSTAQDTPLRVAAPGLLSNDSDVAGDALTAVKVTDPAHGEVFVSADGSFAYFPDAGYVGADSFTYSASDGTLQSNAATVRIQVKDTTTPTISPISPKSRSTIADTTPTIKATVKDNFTNLQQANIKLYINDNRISATKYSYSAAKDLLTYNSPKLSLGKKTVKIVATDAAKNVGTKSWSFTIK